MSSEQDRERRRNSPFPMEMQGDWIGQGEPEFCINVDGSEIIWNRRPFEYIDKLKKIYEDGSVVIQVMVPYRIDSGDDINLVASPEGELHAFSVHFAITLIRSEADGRPRA